MEKREESSILLVNLIVQSSSHLISSPREFIIQKHISFHKQNRGFIIIKLPLYMCLRLLSAATKSYADFKVFAASRATNRYDTVGDISQKPIVAFDDITVLKRRPFIIQETLVVCKT